MNVRFKPLNRCRPYKSYAYDPARRLVFCGIPKNGSTTWFEWMYQLQRDEPIGSDFYYDYINDHLRLRNYSARVARQALFGSDHLRFVVVRNPWNRLLSAFTNKVVTSDNLDVNRDCVHMLVPRSQQGALTTDTERGEFLGRYTFRQYIEAVVAWPKRRQNEHWRPQHLYLGKARFDLVGRFEEIPSFCAQLARRLEIPIELRRLNTTTYTPGSGESTPQACLADVPIRELRAHGGFSRNAFFDAQLIELVAGYYHEDVTRFGYRYEGIPAVHRG